MAGGAAAALAVCDQVRLAGGPLIMSARILYRSACLLLVGSDFLRILCLLLTLGADWLLLYCTLLSSKPCVSTCCDLEASLWLSTTLGGGIGGVVLALVLGLLLMLARAPSTSCCSSRVSNVADCPPIPLIVFITSCIANMTLLVYVINGFVIRLCLKSTVSDKRSLLVSFM